MRSATDKMQYLFDYHKHTMDFVTDSILGKCEHKNILPIQDSPDGIRLKCVNCQEEE